HYFPTRRSSDLNTFLPLLPSPYKNANFCSFTSPVSVYPAQRIKNDSRLGSGVPSRREDTSRTCSCQCGHSASGSHGTAADCVQYDIRACCRSEEHTSELQSRE